MKTEIVESIKRKVIELSDLKIQRQLWLNENNDTGFISSYIELMSTLFDDYCFDKFVDTDITHLNYSQELSLELQKLRDELNAYPEKENDLAIIEDPAWIKIVNHAKLVLSIWEREDRER